MTLRNAFEALATEGTLRRLLDRINWARDTQDRMVVRIGASDVTQLSETITTRFGNNAVSPTTYATGAPQAFDARENSRAMQRPIAVQPRRDRWTF